MSDMNWHDDRIPMEFRCRAAREHNARMVELASASREEAALRRGHGDETKAQQCDEDARAFLDQRTEFGATEAAS